jgi:hypothetical protein
MERLAAGAASRFCLGASIDRGGAVTFNLHKAARGLLSRGVERENSLT